MYAQKFAISTLVHSGAFSDTFCCNTVSLTTQIQDLARFIPLNRFEPLKTSKVSNASLLQYRVTPNPDPRPKAGGAIPISAFVLPNTAAVQSVQLTYLVNYGSPTNLPMQAGTGSFLTAQDSSARVKAC